MSNSQFKREEAKYHNEQYEAKRFREQNNLPEWADVGRHIFGNRKLDVSEVEEVKITEATESKVSQQQAVGRADRQPGDVVVIGAGQTSFGRAAMRVTAQALANETAKRIAFATPEMMGELGRQQAREEMAIICQDDLTEAKQLAAALSLAGGKYDKSF
jgi:hypothetical protein